MNQQDRILLILDIDETLLYATGRPLNRDHDFKIGSYFVYLRPFLIDFLNQARKHFQIAVWSSSSCDYVAAIVDTIFPKSIQLEFAWSRQRCTPRIDPEWHQQYYVKDLRKVKRRGYDLNRVLIVEDTPQQVERHYGNALYVTPYFGDDTDAELKLLIEYLLTLSSQANLRRIEKRGWNRPLE